MSPLADGEVIELGNTMVRALATPGHAPAHLAYVVADRRRETEEPWLVFTGDSLLVGDVGRPDLHAAGDPEPLAREQSTSIERLLELARPRARLPEPLRRLGLRPWALGQSVLEHRFRAPAQRGARSTRRGASPRRCSRPAARATDQQAIVDANRAGRATRT